MASHLYEPITATEDSVSYSRLYMPAMVVPAQGRQGGGGRRQGGHSAPGPNFKRAPSSYHSFRLRTSSRNMVSFSIVHDPTNRRKLSSADRELTARIVDHPSFFHDSEYD